jgi:hypothetical protein
MRANRKNAIKYPYTMTTKVAVLGERGNLSHKDQVSDNLLPAQGHHICQVTMMVRWSNSGKTIRWETE